MGGGAHSSADSPTVVTSSSSSSLLSQLDPNIKFLFAPPGVAIPPQPYATYQLVPAGHQVVPVTNGQSHVVNKSASTTAEARAAGRAHDQEEDEKEDEERLLREPIVLSGKPYSYPVNIGKDVVSGKGGRVRRLDCRDFFKMLFLNRQADIFSIAFRLNNTTSTFGVSLRTLILVTMKQVAKLKSVKSAFESISPSSRPEVASWMLKEIQ